MKKESKIKIIFHFETLKELTFKPLIIFFYLKNNIDTLFYKEMVFDINILSNSSVNNIFEHIERNWEYYENILVLNQYKCTKNDIDKAFMSYRSVIYDDQKNELLTILRKNKINNILK